jgi:glutamine amidotransferase-like uncharacterized protein
MAASCTPVLPDAGSQDPQNPILSPGGNPGAFTDVMIYNGIGVSTSDWQATEEIVSSHSRQGRGWTYRLVNSAELNAMSLEEIASFGVIVVPGGKGGTITSYLNSSTRLNLRRAVQEFGVGYVGFCAGAWIAVGPEADTPEVASYGLAVAEGVVLSTYWPDGNTSLTADIVPVTLQDGTVRNLVWWGGPSTPEWKLASGQSGVLGRYKTGQPAISQTVSGRGVVVISGPHPEAPQSWWATAGTDPDGLDWDLAERMIDGALSGTLL